MDLTPGPDLVGWTPIRLDWEDGRPTVDWCHTAGLDFTEPFFHETVERCFRHPYRLLFRHRTGMEEVGHLVASKPGLAPAGFVFHMSRCGSTLVSQMLAAVPEHLVLSEPGPIDSVLRAREMQPDLSDGERVTWLRSMVGALGQARGPQTRMFVKFDAWSALELPVIRRAFPDVPWLFLFRDPVEVLGSHAGRPGAHVIPGALPPGLFGVPVGTPLLEHAARVLARISEAALEWEDDPLTTFVDYADLPDDARLPCAAGVVDGGGRARPGPDGGRRGPGRQEPLPEIRPPRTEEAGHGHPGDGGRRRPVAVAGVRTPASGGTGAPAPFRVRSGTPREQRTLATHC